MEIYFAIIAFVSGFLIRKYIHNFAVFRDWINKFLIYLGLPFVVLYAASSRGNLSLKEIVLISVLLSILFTFIVYFVVSKFRMSGADKASLYMCSAYGNTAFIGIPIAFLFFGNVGATIAGIFSFILMIFHYSIGIVLANKLKGKSKFMMSYLARPFIWILLVALILTQLNIKFPSYFSIISAIVSLLAILIVGISLDTKYLTLKNTYFSLLKLIFVPLLAFLVLIVFNFEYKSIFILLSATPSAIMNTSLALEFKYNEKLASGLTSIGTFLFLVGTLIFAIITTIQ